MALTKRIATGPRIIASRRVLVPKPSPKRFYGHGIPGVDPERDVRVSVDNGVLTVEAQRTEETHESIAPSSFMACCAGR